MSDFPEHDVSLSEAPWHQDLNSSTVKCDGLVLNEILE